MSIGQNIPHDSAYSHVTGQSIYVDDRPQLPGEIMVGFLGSPIACGELIDIDYGQALKLKNVLAIYTAKDFAHNLWGTIVQEQPILVEKNIQYMDEPICIIAATDQQTIYEARKLIKLNIKEKNPIVEIDQAIEQKSFVFEATPFRQGDYKQGIKNAPHQLKGEFECGGQEHFYMESQASVVYPLENNQFEVHSSSQHPTETQHVVAHALGIGYHQVTCIVKRMGGGFGGKESQAAPFAAMAALVAHKFKKPARIVLSKDDDMLVTGKRHPFKNQYQIGFDEQGKILGMHVKIYSNAGAYADLSSSILERAMFHVDGAYYFPHCLIEAWACRTNMHSNTAFRGFGGPQGNMTMESIMEDIASYLNIDAAQVRKINLYQKGQTTPYGQVVTDNVLPEIYSKIMTSSDYQKRLKEIKGFNQKKCGKIKGLSLTSVKFGIAFTAKFLNQANALVNIHLDGTIQVSTGATEMGQGVNTKMQQIVAHAFAIDPTQVQVMPTSTEKNHNTSPTAASSGSDLNGAACFKACEKLQRRLRVVADAVFRDLPFDDIKEIELGKYEDLSHIEFTSHGLECKKTKKNLSFQEAIKIAFLNRISLGAYAHYKTPKLGFDKKTSQGTPFNYFTNGMAVTEVEVDEYTGEAKLQRVDILMDLGRPINPGIDMGQVIGGFIQGVGWVTTENLYYSDKLDLISHSPTTYKIPNIQDTPRVFKVDLIENDLNEQAVHRSKAVGEPPLLLGTSAWTAIKNAIQYRNKNNLPSELKSPATNEEILMELTRVKK